jgi:hypothetical protein
MGRPFGAALFCAGQADSGKALWVRTVSMLVGLIRSTSPSRVHEDSADYGTRPARETD